MHHRNVILFLVIFFAPLLKAQNLVKNQSLAKQQRSLEKVYLHVDREQYQLRDTIWFKAYLSQDHLPDTMSTVLYTEVWSSTGKRYGQQVWPVIFGTSYGQFEIPDSCKPGEYMIRAWTPLMGNNQKYDQQYFRIGKTFRTKETPRKDVSWMGSPDSTAGTDVKLIPSTAVSIQFFPEGGKLIGSVLNSVAFQLKDNQDRLTEGNGELIDETGQKLLTISTTQQGRGVFEWVPENKKKYFVKLAGQQEPFALPIVQLEGVALRLLPHAQGWFFELHSGAESTAFKPAYMVGQMQDEVVFSTVIDATKRRWQGLINTAQLRSGIMQVTLFNKDSIPLAERRCFINNGDYITPVKLQLDTLSFKEHAINSWKLQMTDTINASLSVSVTDATNDIETPANENIVSSYLLSTEWPERILNPAWYFSANTDSVLTGLDLFMMTDGWGQLPVEFGQKSRSHATPFKDPGYINLEGIAYLKGTRKPFANKDLVAIMGAMGKGRNLFMTKTDERGMFTIDSLLFFGNVRFYFMEPKGKKSQYIEIELLYDTIPVGEPPLPKTWKSTILAATTVSNEPITNNLDQEEGILLEEVTVEAHRKSPEQIVDERYTRGAFSGFASKTIDLVSGDPMITEPTIFDYLARQVPSLTFTTNGPDYVLYYRQAPTASSMGPIPMTVFLNEIETDASIIATISPNDIALVKVFSTFVGAFGNGAGGALAIYTKKGTDMTKAVARGDVVTYRGFTPSLEFKSLDYRSLSGSFLKADRRKTLDWRPNIFVNHVNPSIPIRFYNNDGAKAYRIRVEGMTQDGKLIWLEQIIRSDKSN